MENLYFRRAHLHRPLPTISPGGRRNFRRPTSNPHTHAAPSLNDPGSEEMQETTGPQGNDDQTINVASQSSKLYM